MITIITPAGNKKLKAFEKKIERCYIECLFNISICIIIHLNYTYLKIGFYHNIDLIKHEFRYINAKYMLLICFKYITVICRAHLHLHCHKFSHNSLVVINKVN